MTADEALAHPYIKRMWGRVPAPAAPGAHAHAAAPPTARAASPSPGPGSGPGGGTPFLHVPPHEFAFEAQKSTIEDLRGEMLWEVKNTPLGIDMWNRLPLGPFCRPFFGPFCLSF